MSTPSESVWLARAREGCPECNRPVRTKPGPRRNGRPTVILDEPTPLLLWTCPNNAEHRRVTRLQQAAWDLRGEADRQLIITSSAGFGRRVEGQLCKAIAALQGQGPATGEPEEK